MNKRILAVQFGNTYQRRAAGYKLITLIYTDPRCVWIDGIFDGAHMNVDEALLEGFVRIPKPADLRIGLTPGTYQVTLTFYDPTKGHGPFSIVAGDSRVLSRCTTTAGEIVEKSFYCQAEGNSLTLRFIPEEGKDIVLNALVLTGQEDEKLLPVFKTAPPAKMPGRTELDSSLAHEPEAALREVCDWLLDHRRENGFLGDAWEGNAPYWYTASMPVRALLAGYDILGDQKYLDAGLVIMDLFASEQTPNGAFPSVLRGRITSELTEAEIQHIYETERLPMSDVGSVVSALAIATKYAGPEHRKIYQDSLVLFCDKWASLFQKRDGSFTDGPNTGTYSCASAIEASAFSLASKATGETKFLQSAKRALRFLLPDWMEDGRMIGRAPHWPVRNRLPFVMETLYFGDQWYYDEGFITSAHYVEDPELKRDLLEALQHRVFGDCGLLRALGDGVWWPVQDVWNNAKSLGMVQTLLAMKSFDMSTPELEDALKLLQQVICTPEYSHRLGVMVDDSEHPADKFGSRSWGGMATEATGFAGMTIAEMIKPGVLYLI